MGDLVHGWRVFVSFRWIVVIVAAFSVIVMVERGAMEVMGPVLAKQEYGGAAGWAVVLTGMSLGLLAGGIAASRLRPGRPMVVAMLGMLALPVLLVALAFSVSLALVTAFAFVLGIAWELMAVLWFTALQVNVPRESLSRVSAYDAMGSLMFGPIGLALAGPLIAAIGLESAFLLSAAVITVAVLATLLSPAVRNLTSQSPSERSTVV
jgi:predicted MFS family arabinose efflux permease